jgi:uncharacterized protein (TIGR02145 family)
MKRISLFLVVAFLATSIFIACKKEEPSDNNSPEKIGVLINGVVWSPFNVDATGKFVDNPEDFGIYYQWNRKDTTDFVLCTDYIPTYYPSYWLPNNNPCPKDWRVPTLDELNKLLNTEKVTSEWITENGINGYRFTEKSSGNSIFLPAAGYINCYIGLLLDVGYQGNYWSSTADGTNAHLLGFRGKGHCSGEASPFSTIGYRTGGFSIRPVAEKN